MGRVVEEEEYAGLERRERWAEKQQEPQGGPCSALLFHGWGSRKPLGWHNLQESGQEAPGISPAAVGHLPSTQTAHTVNSPELYVQKNTKLVSIKGVLRMYSDVCTCF